MDDETDIQAATAIVNAAVYCCDEDSRSFNPGAVVFSGGVIDAVGPAGDVEVPEVGDRDRRRGPAGGAARYAANSGWT